MFPFRRRVVIVREPSALEIVRDAKYPLIAAPFFGQKLMVQVRELTQAEIASIGEFSLIETFYDKVMKKDGLARDKWRELVRYADRTHDICKAAMFCPTYEQVMLALGADPEIDRRREELDELRENLTHAPDGRERRELEAEIDRLRIWVDLLLPEDFSAWIVAYALGLDRSDIRKVTENMLVEAAVLAELGHDNPHDHIEGRFTEFNKVDIDKRAWLLWSERKAEEQRKLRAKQKSSGRKQFAGW